MSTPSYAELRCKTAFSFLRGASQPSELVQQAAELGLTAIAMTDIGSLAGVVRAHMAWRDEVQIHRKSATGLSLVIGSEIEPTDGPPLVLLARNREGYAHLCRLLTIGRRRAPKGRCELNWHDVLPYAGGLSALVTFEAANLLRDAARREQLHNQLGSLREAFCGSIYICMEHHGSPVNTAACRAVDAFAALHGLAAVVTNNVHYHHPSRQMLQDVFVAIREGVTVTTAGHRLLPNATFALRGAQEQHRIFQKILGLRGAAAVERSVQIAAECTFSLDEIRYEYPDEIVPSGETPATWLRKLAMEGAAGRYPRGVPAKVLRLIEHELQLIEELHYEPYFLTVYDIVRHARGRGILCQGRGSAANSAVCYCIGITAVDPSRTELLFERFISKERNEPPDIDIDFEHERREEVIQYVYEKYGRDRAGIAASVICYRGRSAVRDVGRALGLSVDQVDRLAGALDRYDVGEITESHLAEAGLSGADQNIKNMIQLVAGIADFPRHLSQHVGGFVISRGPLCELVPIENATMEGRTVVEWDKDDLDALGLIKVDLLALGILTATRKCMDMVRDCYNTNLTLATIPSEDPETYEMLCHADAVGVFQVESRAQRAMLPRLRPRRFYDLVVQVAIVRPGPIQGGMVHPYLRRRAGEEPYDMDEFPGLRDILERTHGVPLFQEQVMRIAVAGAGFTPGEADRLRRAMGAWKKRGILEGFYNKFIVGMLSSGYPREFAERVFEQIRGFGEYGFPESHAASFALIAYATSYLKRFYPAAFTASLLNSQPMGFYAPAQLVRDAREHGVEVRPVDINKSQWDCTLEKINNRRVRAAQDGAVSEAWGKPGPALRLGFRLVKNLDQISADRIVYYRDAGGDYTSIESCASRAQLDRRALSALVDADAFASTGVGRRAAVWRALGVAELPDLFKNIHDDSAGPDLPEAPQSAQVAQDYESTGLSLRAHPLACLRADLEQMGVRPNCDLMTFPNQTQITVAGIVLTRQRPSTASGVVFVTLEDETGVANLVVTPRVFERDRLAARGSTAMVALGVIERQGEVIHLRAIKLWPLEQLQIIAAKSRDFH